MVKDAVAKDDRHSKSAHSSVKADQCVKKSGALNGDVKNLVRDSQNPAAVDSRDPNYDSEAEDASDYVLQESWTGEAPPKEGGYAPQEVPLAHKSSFGTEAELGHELPANWTLESFQKKVLLALEEYYVSLELEDCVARLRDLLTDCPSPDELVVVSVRKAFESLQEKQKLVSRLLIKLHKEGVLNSAALVRGFEKLVCTWEDAILDAPGAPNVLTSMLYSCILEGCVSEDMLCRLPEGLISSSLEKAEEELKGKMQKVKDELQEFKKRIAQCIKEYYVAMNIAEVEKVVRELGKPSYRHEFVKKVITSSFTGQNPEMMRESALNLFVHLSNVGVLGRDDLQWGVTRLLGQLEDITLDCPRAIPLATEFCSAMVVDELLTAPFLRRCRLLRVGGANGLSVLEGAQKKIPVYWKKQLGEAQFKREIHTMILEYFNSEDCAEVGRLIRELSPMTTAQSAEVVRKLMVFAMERTGKECELSLKLMLWLCRHEEIDLLSVETGFNDLYDRMSDIILDVPDAEEMTRSFVVECKNEKLLREEWEPPRS